MTHPLTYHPKPHHPRAALLRLTRFASVLSTTFFAAALPLKYLFNDWVPPVVAAYVLALLFSAAVAIKSAASLGAQTPDRSSAARGIFALTILAGLIL